MDRDHDEHKQAKSTTIPVFNPIQSLFNNDPLNLFAEISHWRHS